PPLEETHGDSEGPCSRRLRLERRHRRGKTPRAVPLAGAPAGGGATGLRPVPPEPREGHQPSVAWTGGDRRRLRRGHAEGRPVILHLSRPRPHLGARRAGGEGPRRTHAARQRPDARQGRVDAPDLGRARGHGLLRHHRGPPADRLRRRLARAIQGRQGRLSLLLRRWHHQYRGLPRGLEFRRGVEAAGGLRLRKQPLHGIHADRRRDRRRASRRRPRRRLRTRAHRRRWQRCRRRLSHRANGLREGARRQRAVADRVHDLPPLGPFARRPRQIPARGRARSMERARSDQDLPRASQAIRRQRKADGRHRGQRAQGSRRRHRGLQGRALAARRYHDHRRLRRRRLGLEKLKMAEITYRDAVIRGIAQEMSRDPDVVFLGEDVAKAGGVFKATVGLYEQFGPLRVRDTPISEQAILGAAMGAAMTGLKPIAEIMFSDYIANEFPKSRYMTNGQVKVPLVVRTGNGGGARFGAQHSQSVENWCMMIPGLKVVAPSSPVDVIGLLAASVRDPDPVIFLEHKSLYATKGEVPDGEIVDTLGTAKIVRPGKDATILALALMVPRALAAAEKLKAEHGIDCEVVDVRSLVPLDTQTILGSVAKTHRLFTVEENPRLCGWGAEIVSIAADEGFYDLDGSPVRITTPHIPLPAADILEDIVLPTPDRITETVRRSLGS